MSTGFEQDGAGRFRVRGDLDFDAVPALWATSTAVLDAREPGDVLIDLAGVGRVDSAGLALVVEWLRWARERERRLRLANVPEKLAALARISELGPLVEEASAGT